MANILFNALIILSIISANILFIFWIFKHEIESIKAYKKDFICIRCGHCCNFDVILTPNEISNIKELGYDPNKFIAKKLGFSFISKKENGNCFFLEKDKLNSTKCLIYEKRPFTCVKFPNLKYGPFKAMNSTCKGLH